MGKQPDFIIIGAMKCATTTLHEQLAMQPGIFMTEPKEPNFFSNDEVYDQGWEWYQDLFAPAHSSDLCGESSTHYTKLPTYPHTVTRLKQHLPQVKLIYIMRDPIQRLVSQYIHEWTKLKVSDDINQAIYDFPSLVTYSQYSRQLQPYLETFGLEQVLPVFVENLQANPQAELERVCRFISYDRPPQWQPQLAQQHKSGERTRESVWRDRLIDLPVLKHIRRSVIPKEVRNWVRSWWQMKHKPTLTPESLAYLRAQLDPDLARLGRWLGLSLTCETFRAQVTASSPAWLDVDISVPSQESLLS